MRRGSEFWVVARTVVGFRRRKYLEDFVLLCFCRGEMQAFVAAAGLRGFFCSPRASGVEHQKSRVCLNKVQSLEARYWREGGGDRSGAEDGGGDVCKRSTSGRSWHGLSANSPSLRFRRQASSQVRITGRSYNLVARYKFSFMRKVSMVELGWVFLPCPRLIATKPNYAFFGAGCRKVKLCRSF